MVSLQPTATSAYPLLPAISGRQHLRSAAISTGSGLQLDNEVSQSTDQPHGTVCHQHYGPVGERLQVDTENAPVLDRPGAIETSS